MHFYEYALSDYETFEPIILAHEKKFGKIKFRRYIEQAHKIMVTEQKYIDMLNQDMIYKNDPTDKYHRLEEDLGFNYGSMQYYVTQDRVHDIIVQVLVDKFDFTLVEVQAGYYYRNWKHSCIEVPAEIVQEPIIDVIDNIDDTIDADDPDTWYIEFVMKDGANNND